MRNPAVFLFDEPLSALDAKLRVDMRVEIKKLHERLGATFIYVTHDQIEALTMADRIAVIDNGRLQQYGTPDEVYERPINATVAKFVGSPSMNLVPGRVSEEKDNWKFQARGLSLPLFGSILDLLRTGPPSEAVLGIRPEGVEVNGINNHGSVSGLIYATEPQGSDLFLDISFGESDAPEQALFKVRTQPDVRLRAGDRVSLTFPMEKLYLFDSSGRRIYP